MFGFMVKCSFVWNVQWMETEVEKRMRGKPSVLRKLLPFWPPNLTRHLQLQKSWSEIIDSQRFWIPQLLDIFAGNRLIFSGFPFFQRKTAHFCEEITAYNRKNVRGNINSIGRKRNCKGRNLNSKGKKIIFVRRNQNSEGRNWNSEGKNRNFEGQNLDPLPFLGISKPFSKSEMLRVRFSLS